MGTVPQRVLETVGTAVGVGCLLLVGAYLGLDFWTVTVDVLAVHADFFEASLSVAGFTLLIVVVGGFIVRGVRGVPPADADGPEMRAVVPAYRDANVLENSVESLLESDYAPLTVAVVVEPGDTATRRRATELAAAYDDVACLVNGIPGSKAGAVNYAVRESDADYFAVFDADERISPSFIPGVMSHLRDGADVVQGRRIPRPTGPVETLAYCERFLVHTGYAVSELLGFTHCQSSSTAFTRAAFRRAGGYDDKLTEDIDFSHKCYRAGLEVVRDRRLTNTMEAPHTLRDLWGQRKRWRIGHVQVVESRVKEAIDGGLDAGSLASVGRAAGGIFGGAFLLIVSVHAVLLFALGVESAFLVPYAAFLGAVGGVWLRDWSAGRVPLPSPAVLLAPVVVFGHGVLTVKSLLEYYLSWDGEWYEVTKTGG